MVANTIDSLPMLAIAPAQVWRGQGIISQLGDYLSRWRYGVSRSILVVAGARAKDLIAPHLERAAIATQATIHYAPAIADCTETNLAILREEISTHQIATIVGAGGGKALDTAKLAGDLANLPVVTIPTTGATCAAWTALSNVYSEAGAFSYDVALGRCPDLMVVDYDLIATAPQRTLVAGIGDAIAKWYEASVSSGSSDRTMVIAAVQEARILRDILLQKSKEAIENLGGDVWREVVDATVCLAGVIGGVGGAQCRTVAAHAVHNGLTHLLQSHGTLHGEKVAYGILVQLRLEEFQGSQLATTARHQLLKFYDDIGLPKNLADLGLADVTLRELETAAIVACRPESDIHRLPFTVSPSQLTAAMVSTTAPISIRD
ncbi:iron-containing alcohol dehydrogenase family protein [Pseudanabaena sp. PCC 6802]|uniref:iron-containing alcohol dehydrogenase family protein n=1 Tax=Pseudanabaena sp. PCC 6802 TaxID=118173 RepID=UPI00034505B6|nr:iron-containing alcohol dehydrogenase family protein [Pseudanabaena sp. PCC 6802]